MTVQLAEELTEEEIQSGSIELNQIEDSYVVFGRGGHLLRQRRFQEFRHLVLERKFRYRYEDVIGRNRIFSEIIQTALDKDTKFFQHRPELGRAVPMTRKQVKQKIRQMYVDCFKPLNAKKRKTKQGSGTESQDGHKKFPDEIVDWPNHVPATHHGHNMQSNASQNQHYTTTEVRKSATASSTPVTTAQLPISFSNCVQYLNRSLEQIEQRQMEEIEQACQILEKLIKDHGELKMAKARLGTVKPEDYRGVPPGKLLDFIAQSIASDGDFLQQQGNQPMTQHQQGNQPMMQHQQQGNRPMMMQQQQQQGNKPMVQHQQQGNQPMMMQQQQGNQSMVQHQQQGNQPMMMQQQQGNQSMMQHQQQSNRPMQQQGNQPMMQQQQGNQSMMQQQQSNRPMQQQGNQPMMQQQQGNQPMMQHQQRSNRPMQQQGNRPMVQQHLQGNQPMMQHQQQHGNQPMMQHQQQGTQPMMKHSNR